MDTAIDDNALSATIALADYLPFIEVAVNPDDNVMKNITFADFVAEVESELGLGAIYQPLDATLTAFAALTIAADTLTIGTGADSFSQTAFAANTFPARASTGNLVAKTITDFGLSLVDDADAATALLTLGAAPLASPTFTGTPAAPTATPGTNTTQLATTAFVTAAISTAVSGVLDLQGNIDASTNPNYPAGTVGAMYYVSVAGRVGGASGKVVAVGDSVICKADNAGGDEATVGTSWFVLEKNLDGALLAANNLSDVASAATARTNLGLGTMATAAAADYLLLAGGTMGASALLQFGGATSSFTALKNVSGQLHVRLADDSGLGVLIGSIVGATNAYLHDSQGLLIDAGVDVVIRRVGWDSVGGLVSKSTVPVAWSSGDASGTRDVYLYRDAAAVLALRNGSNAQTSRVYRTWTDASNSEYFQTTWSGTTCYLQTQKAGTGTVRDIEVRCANYVALRTVNASTQLFLLNDLFQLDNGDGPRIFGIQTLQNNSAPIHIRSGGGDGLKMLHGGGATLENSATPDTVATLQLTPRGTQLAPLLTAASTTISGDGTFKVASGKLLQFGGTSATETALKRSSTELQVRLADDSAFSDLRLANLYHDGQAARSVTMARHTTANTAGNNLTVQAGGATAAATDKNGGYLDLVGGISTGTGASGVRLKGYAAGGTGTADNTASTVIEVLGNKLGFFGATPVSQQASLTATLTTITHTAPGTPDYAVAALTDTGGFGFATADEGHTVLSVIANLQARVNELETIISNLGFTP